MFKRLFLILVFACVSAPALADDEIVTNYPPNGQTEQRTEKQVLKLPQDENKLYMTLYGDPSDERYVKLRKWFNENDDLRAIRQQTHYAAIDSTSKLFQDRYADEIDKVPCIRIVTPGGVEVLRIDGNKIPMSDLSLNKGIRTELLKRLFGNGDDDNQKQQKKSPNQKFKEEFDKKIDNDLDLPPVAKAVVGDLIHKIVYTIILAAVAIGGLVGVISTIRQSNRSA